MVETDNVARPVMRLACSRDELNAKLAFVARAVSTRSALHVLSGVFLRAASGRLELAATDMEVSVRASLHADVEDEGSVVVPGRLLLDIAQLLPPGDVLIEHRAGEGTVRIEGGASTYRLHTYSVEDFPRLPDLEALRLFTIDRNALLDTVSRVSRAASRDESRPVLTGILVRFEAGKIVMAATDSYRLAVKETALETAGGGPELEAIIPARALAELGRIAQGGDTVEFALHDNHVAFLADGVALTSRRIDGQFPNFKQLVPESFEYELPLPRGELIEVVRRVAVMAQRNSPLRLRFADGELRVSAQTQEVGEAWESMPAPFTGEPLEIGFNAGFLRDGLDSVVGDELLLRLIGPLRPAVINDEAGDFTYLVMPLRLPG